MTRRMTLLSVSDTRRQAPPSPDRSTKLTLEGPENMAEVPTPSPCPLLAPPYPPATVAVVEEASFSSRIRWLPASAMYSTRLAGFSEDWRGFRKRARVAVVAEST